MNHTILVFAPHPDDETFWCGGTIAKKISEGYEVIIVVITDGRNLYKTTLEIEDNPSPEEVRNIRREEVILATKILGVPRENLFFLNFKDGALNEQEEEAEAKIMKILEEYSPFEVYFPNINDQHLDHQVTNKIVRNCLRKLRLTSTKYQYPAMHKYSRIGPLIDIIFNLFKKNRVEVNVSEFLDLKEKAVKEFKLEMSLISKIQKKSINSKIEKFLRKKEKFYIA